MSSSYIVILIIMLAACYFLFVRKPKTPAASDTEINKPESASEPRQNESANTDNDQ